MKLKQFAFSLITFSVAIVFGPKAAQAVSLTPIADGLDNPRNLAFGSDGSIYVTESGRGGDGADGRCIPSPSAQYIPLCAGDTGSLLRITPDGRQEPVIDNFTSLALTPSGEQAAGPADIKFDSEGNAYFLSGFAGDPSNRETVLGTPELGLLSRLDLNTGSLTTLADLAQYEIDNNTDGTDVITNPYAMEILGDTAYVVDGGANTITAVALDGSGIENARAFPEQEIPQNELEFPSLPPAGEIPPGTGGEAPPSPGGEVPPSGGETPPAPIGELPPGQEFPITYQSVPTAITTAPDGSLTVAEYTYFPYPEGRARIYSVDPNTLDINVLYEGFTQLTGVTYDTEGNLYALQHINTSEWKEIQQGGIITGDISGSIIRIGPDGTRETIWNGNGLEAASGLFFGPDGDLYTSNRSRLAGTGQVLSIDLDATTEGETTARSVPEPASAIGLIVACALGATAVKRKVK
jgi:sugar lactone lactonase YvrE